MDTVLEAFITLWVARFGVPARITTNRGTQFTSGMWGDWCQKQGVQHITITAYHPQVNGMVEQIHRILKAALCALGGVPQTGRITCPGSCWACGPLPGRNLVCQLQRRPYSISCWCLASYRHPVSSQLA